MSMTPAPADLLQAAIAACKEDEAECPPEATVSMTGKQYKRTLCALITTLTEIAAYEAWALSGYQPGDVLGVKLSEARAAREKACREFVGEGK